jgi:predicted nuclease of predicted toxin-antitoxin system
MMKFLTDENIGTSLTEFLRSKGYDVKSVSEFFPSRDDTSIINIAYQENRIIVTNDKDFGYLTFKAKLPPPSIILFRFKQEILDEKIKAISAILNFPEDKIINHFIVVSENKIRIRQIKSLDN